MPDHSPGAGFAALYIDYENVYYYLQQRFNDPERSSDAVSEMIRKLKNLIEQEVPVIIMHAYADFERLESKPQGALYLLGVETHNVLGTDHKNAADMRLSIDVLETMYTRPEIDRFVFMAGDRDYIPVIQHLRKHAKAVIVTAFPDSMSGDLLQNVGERNFIDSLSLLSTLTKEEMAKAMKVKEAEEKREAAYVTANADRTPRPVVSQTFARPRSISDPDEVSALEIMLRDFGDKPEVWVTPFLHRLRAELPHLAEYERKTLITNLEEYGALKVEKRPGDPAPYSVIMINWKHPDVIRLNPG